MQNSLWERGIAPLLGFGVPCTRYLLFPLIIASFLKE